MSNLSEKKLFDIENYLTDQAKLIMNVPMIPNQLVLTNQTDCC